MPAQSMEIRLSKLVGRTVELVRSDQKQFVGELLEGEEPESFVIQSGGRGRPPIVYPSDVERVKQVPASLVEQLREEQRIAREQQRIDSLQGVPYRELQRAVSNLIRLCEKYGIELEEAE